MCAVGESEPDVCGSLEVAEMYFPRIKKKKNKKESARRNGGDIEVNVV